MNLYNSKILKEILELKINDSSFIISSICASTFVVLSQFEILKDVPVFTGYPTFSERLGSSYVDERVVVSKSGTNGATVLTCKLMLFIILFILISNIKNIKYFSPGTRNVTWI